MDNLAHLISKFPDPDRISRDRDMDMTTRKLFFRIIRWVQHTCLFFIYFWGLAFCIGLRSKILLVVVVKVTVTVGVAIGAAMTPFDSSTSITLDAFLFYGSPTFRGSCTLYNICHTKKVYFLIFDERFFRVFANWFFV